MVDWAKVARICSTYFQQARQGFCLKRVDHSVGRLQLVHVDAGFRRGAKGGKEKEIWQGLISKGARRGKGVCWLAVRCLSGACNLLMRSDVRAEVLRRICDGKSV